jgi:hypothetical protein
MSHRMILDAKECDQGICARLKILRTSVTPKRADGQQRIADRFCDGASFERWSGRIGDVVGSGASMNLA